MAAFWAHFVENVRLDGHPAPVLVLGGEIDIEGAEELSDAFEQAIMRSSGTLQVDMSRVEFMDATGIGTLVQAEGAARHRGLDLVVARPSSQVSRLLQLCELDGHITVVPAGGA